MDSEGSMDEPLHHLDALLSLEAAHLTDDELSLVADMVQQLVGGSVPSTPGGNSSAQQQQQQQFTATPAGLNLAEQIEQLLPGAMQHAGMQEQQHQKQEQQLQQQQDHSRMSTAALAAHSLHSNEQQQQPEVQHTRGLTPYAAAVSPKSPAAASASAAGSLGGFGSCYSLGGGGGRPQFSPYPLGGAAAEVTGLSSPGSSVASVSEHSSPVSSPVARHHLLAKSPSPPPPQSWHGPVSVGAVGAAGLGAGAGAGAALAAATAAAAATSSPTAQPDAATRAAAEVLSAALADPNASLEDIVCIFDKVLAGAVPNKSPGGAGAGAGGPPQQPARNMQDGRGQPAPQQRFPAPDLNQHLLQQAELQPHTPKLASKQHAVDAYLQQQGSSEIQQQLHAQQQQQRQAVPGAGRHLDLDACSCPHAYEHHSSSSRLSTQAVASGAQLPEQWQQQQQQSQQVVQQQQQADRPSTAPAHAGNSSKFPGRAGGNSPPSPQHTAACTAAVGQHGSRSGGLMSPASPRATRRSGSPDVFTRLSAVSTVSFTAKTAAAGSSAMPLQQPRHSSSSPTEAQRTWLAGLRGASPSSNNRSRSTSRSRSPSCSPPRRQQQEQQLGAEGAEGVPWLTAASMQSARQSASPGPVEWDADSRSIKSGGGWVSSTNRNSPRRGAADGDEQEQEEQAWAAKKQPVKLPAHVVEERMRRFYERNVDWKRRCAQVYEQQRMALKQGETEGCTFAPAINRKSEKMAQELRTSYPMRSIRPLTPLADAATSLEQQLRKQQQQQQQRGRPASTGRIRQHKPAGQQPGHQQHQGWLHASIGGSSYRSALSTNGGLYSDQAAPPPGVRRLFEDAAVRLQRAEQYKAVTKEAERKARSWSAPRCAAAEGVPSRVYDHFDPERSSSRTRARAADRTECVFHPWTNPRPRPRSPQRSASPERVVVPEEHAQVVEQFVALLDGSPDSPEQLPQQQEQHVGGSGNRLHTVRPGTAPAAATSHHGQQQQQARSPSAKRIGSASRNADLDWDEFIDRQSRFLSRREAKVAAVAANESRKPTCPELSPGSKRILAEKQALSASCSPKASPQQTQQQPDFLGRLEQQSQSHAGTAGTGAVSTAGSSSGSPVAQTVDAARLRAGGRSTGGGSVMSGLSEECTFRPRITPKAAAKKGRSVEDMSEGDRLRREVRLEQLRTKKEARELSGATFRPDLSPSRQRAGEEFLAVPPKLSLSSEGLNAYMASLQEKRRLLDERRRAAERRKQEEELRQCTFSPQTRPAPAYVTEMADVGYTARYIDRVMQGALADAGAGAGGVGGGGGGRLSTTVAAVARALESSNGGYGGAVVGKKASSPLASGSPPAAKSPPAAVNISTRY